MYWCTYGTSVVLNYIQSSMNKVNQCRPGREATLGCGKGEQLQLDSALGCGLAEVNIPRPFKSWGSVNVPVRVMQLHDRSCKCGAFYSIQLIHHLSISHVTCWISNKTVYIVLHVMVKPFTKLYQPFSKPYHCVLQGTYIFHRWTWQMCCRRELLLCV